MTHLLPRFEAMLGRKPVDETLFAVGGDRVNSHAGFLAMNVLFFREHNRICDVLKGQKNPPKDDEQLFQTARNVLIVLLIKIVIEEYINHITPYHFKFRLQPAAFEGARWYRQNWMAIEFNLLYRWHGLVPDTYRIGGREIPLAQTDFHNRPLIDRGLGGLLEDASRQPAGRIGLFNTPSDPGGREEEHRTRPAGEAGHLQRVPEALQVPRGHELRPDLGRSTGPGRVEGSLQDAWTGSSITPGSSPRTLERTRPCLR